MGSEFAQKFELASAMAFADRRLRALGPLYWRDEQSGKMKEVILAYLQGRPLTKNDIAILRWYLHQWVSAPIWKANPYGQPEDFDELIASAETLSTREEISRWFDHALDFGIDPL